MSWGDVAVAAAKTQVVAAEAQLANAAAVLHAARAARQILCGCGEAHPINQLELLVTHWYHEPHGCTEGDYYSEGEWQFVGPCGHINRLYFNDYDVPWAERVEGVTGAEPAFKRLYRNLFASRRDTYKDEERGPHWVNEYVDKHREEFELPPKWVTPAIG